MASTVEVNKSSSIPPYPEMIMSALEALKEPDGSNKTTISKYIESKYGDLPAGHSQLLSYHLNKMKDSGELVFGKNNYTIPDPNTPRRGRGRPPKPKDPSAPVSPASPKRPRGRPPKDSNSHSPSSSGRPRGRPRKMAKPAGGLGGSTEADGASPRKRRGRPPKAKETPLTPKAKETPLSEVSVEI